MILASKVECSPSYKTLFFGLKKNHERNVAVVYPIIFLARRILYAVLILFVTRLPYLAIVILMLTCIAMLALISTEAQWEDSIINR